MDYLTFVIVGIGLSMDCFVVALAIGASTKTRLVSAAVRENTGVTGRFLRETRERCRKSPGSSYPDENYFPDFLQVNIFLKFF